MNTKTDNVLDKHREEMTINVPGVIKTLGEAMYTDPWVALRELIQNASDTCTVRRSPLGENKQPLDPSAPPAAIRVYYESLEGRLVVEDNGCGMTWEEVKKFLSVIGKSRTDDVRDKLEGLGELSWADRLIGRFGLGLLSAFIIGAPVTFETRSFLPDSPTVWWQCDGGQHYEMGHLDITREVGTKVTVTVDTNHRSMFKEDELGKMIKRYADLLPIPIHMGKTGYRKINEMDAPWLREGTLAEYRDYLQARFPEDSILHVIPVEINEVQGNEPTKPALRVGGALFIPKQPDPLRVLVREFGTVGVYVRRMFVAENEPNVLPKWAKFIKGVIDTPDLRETTSRESIRHDENFVRVRNALGQLILNNLRELAETDNRQFREVAAQHNVVIKAMAIAQPELFDAIKDIVLFKVENRVMSLAGYFKETNQVEITPEQKRTVYYSSNIYGIGQHAFLFSEKGWRVIDASSYPDEPFLLAYKDRYPEEVELISLDAAGDRVFVQIEPKEEKWLNLEDAFLHNRLDASVVRFEPADIPAVLVDAKDEKLSDDQLDQILKTEGIEEAIKNVFTEVKSVRDRRRRTMLASGAVLYLNANSEIIQRLAASNLTEYDTVGVMIVLYNNALMLSARALSPDTAKIIFDGNNRTIKQLMDKTEEVRRLKESGADPDTFRRLKIQKEDLAQEAASLQQGATQLREVNRELSASLDLAQRENVQLQSEIEAYRSRENREPQTPYITCFVMIPFQGYEDVFEALQRVLEVKPYFWRVARADHETLQRKIDDNVKQWIDRSHCYVAEITDQNSSVMMELGYAYWYHREKPLLLLQQAVPETKVTADLGGTIWASYQRGSKDQAKMLHEIDQIIRKNKVEFSELRGHAHYLSIYSLSVDSIRVNVAPETAKAICEHYKTIEEYIKAVENELDSLLHNIRGLGRGTATDIRDGLKRLAGI